jgi:prepilin-type N-terminal cleavage/methylation domain-containing protein
MKINLTKRGAFSLLEVLAAMLICGIVLLSLYAGISAGFAVTQVARENLRATQIMVEKLETIRLYTFDQIAQANFVPSTFTSPYYAFGTNQSGLVYSGQVTISPAVINASYSNDLKQVDIQLQWTSGGVPRSRQMNTLIARNGLQAYIY